MSRDKNGRPWAKISQVQAGSVLEPDGGCPCILAKTLKVETDNNGLWVQCIHERHYLNAHSDLASCEPTYVGFYLI